MTNLFPETIGDAFISLCGRYRYGLRRIWDCTPFSGVTFVMLNPSTADASVDDPTIRRCVGFAKSWGFGFLEVVNLFALRATNPADLKTSDFDPIGPENNGHIRAACLRAKTVVAAWGVHGKFLERDKAVLRLLVESGISVSCLGVTKGGHPKHPLYLPANTRPHPLPLLPSANSPEVGKDAIDLVASEGGAS